MIHVESEFLFPEPLLERAAQAALEHESQPLDCEMSIVLTNEARYIGDILISIPRAQAQANAAGHPLESEVQLLVVHGVLHLLGHDHAEAEEKARMWKAQAEILERLGLGSIQIRE